MKKGTILFAICSILLTACSKDTDYYREYFRLEQIVIDNFMEEQGFTLLPEYPRDGVFGEKAFVRLPNGVYLHVIDPGNGDMAVRGTEVASIAKGQLVDLREPTTYFDEFDPESDSSMWTQPFIYGIATVPDYSAPYVLVGEGYKSVMAYVGDSASVSLIVPFSEGCSYQLTHYVPIYFEKVTYTFVK